VLSALIRFLISSWNWHTRLRLKGLRPKRRRRAIRLITDQKARLFFKRATTDGVNRKKDNSYEIKQCFTYGSGLNRFSGDWRKIALFAGGYFSGGESRRTAAASSYRLAQTPVNEAWERNNAWANYRAQSMQVQVPKVSTGTSGSALQHNAGYSVNRRANAPGGLRISIDQMTVTGYPGARSNVLERLACIAFVSGSLALIRRVLRRRCMRIST
jgi:hypothetical protein